MTSQEIRASFVRFFTGKGHVLVPPASLVPDAHATTLFTIAGMEPFVPVFLGREPAPAPRVVSVQPCLRVAGGKNDIDNVGRTGRHATLLEMLGNFSFGDYYKREAIAYAWEYLTATLSISADRLWATVHLDDDEAAQIWRRDIGLPAERISRFDKDNFWDMGPTGPCGPCSEIFYDLGAGAGCGSASCRVGCAACEKAPQGARFIEVWNLVFQQYDRDGDGVLHPLPKQCIDTGMGFERLCMVLAGATSIFDTDLYADVIAALPTAASGTLTADEAQVHRRVIADHARAVTFIIADGVRPSNTDRGYVLRFLIRRAIRSGKLLSMPDGFLARLVPAVVATLESGYPRLREAQARIVASLESEEQLFERTMARGAARIKALLDALPARGARVLSGRDVFELHDTYGFPPELTAEAAREARAEVDMDGYRAAREEQRERARADARAKRAEVRVESGGPSDIAATIFEGYDSLEGRGKVLALYDDAGAAVRSLDSGMRGVVVLDRTPFYAERGGQMGDRGVLAGAAGMTFAVDDTYYADKSYRTILHAGEVRDGVVAVGDAVEALVDPAWRREVRRHHSVTHLLQRALKDVVGESVAQRGSQVYAQRTRFDFDAPGALSREQRAEVSARVNDLIRRDFHGTTEIMPFDEAIARGAVYMKGERYGDVVRVVTFGPSVELCGGTHVTSTGEIGHFVLVSESAISAGVRRVEGLVSESADAYDARLRDEVEHIGSLLSVSRDQVAITVERLAHERRELEKRIAALQDELAAGKAGALIDGAREAAGVPYLAVRAPSPGGDVRNLAKTIRERWPRGVLVVAAGDDGRATLHVSVSEDLQARGLSARELLAALAPHVGGKGGGNAAVAQGGGTNPAGIDAAFLALPALIESGLARR